MFEDSKSRAQELSNDVSFVIFGHKIWDLEGGSIPLSISWFSSTPAEIGLIYMEDWVTFISSLRAGELSCIGFFKTFSQSKGIL